MQSEFETFLDDRLTPAADQFSRRARRIAVVSARLVKAAAVGDMRTVEASLRDLQGLPLTDLQTAADGAAAEFDYRAYLSNGFAKDFEAACAEADLPLEGHFPSYFVFPFPVRVDTEAASVIVNRKRVTTLRPSALVTAIRDERERLERSPFNANEFLGILFTIWQRMNAQQSLKSEPPLRLKQPQPLKQVYKEIALFARWRRDYPESFFAYDVQRLLAGNELRYGEWQCSLERGRSESGALRLVDHEGQARFISTVNFVEVGE